MIKKIKNTLFDFLIRYSYLENIHKFDNIIDKNILNSNNEFLKKDII